MAESRESAINSCSDGEFLPAGCGLLCVFVCLRQIAGERALSRIGKWPVRRESSVGTMLSVSRSQRTERIYTTFYHQPINFCFACWVTTAGTRKLLCVECVCVMWLTEKLAESCARRLYDQFVQIQLFGRVANACFMLALV